MHSITSTHMTIGIAIEAGTSSPWVTRLLEAIGHEVMVANPQTLRMTFSSDSKKVARRKPVVAVDP